MLQFLPVVGTPGLKLIGALVRLLSKEILPRLQTYLPLRFIKRLSEILMRFRFDSAFRSVPTESLFIAAIANEDLIGHVREIRVAALRAISRASGAEMKMAGVLKPETSDGEDPENSDSDLSTSSNGGADGKTVSGVNNRETQNADVPNSLVISEDASYCASTPSREITNENEVLSLKTKKQNSFEAVWNFDVPENLCLLKRRRRRNVFQENAILRYRLSATNHKLEEVVKSSNSLLGELSKLNHTFSKLTIVSSEMTHLRLELGEGKKLLREVEADRNEMRLKLLTLEQLIKEEEEYLDDISDEPVHDELGVTSVARRQS